MGDGCRISLHQFHESLCWMELIFPYHTVLNMHGVVLCIVFWCSYQLFLMGFTRPIYWQCMPDNLRTVSVPMGHLPDTLNCGLRIRGECREHFPRHHGLAIPTCITARAWRMPGSITSDFLLSRWRGKRSLHSRRMRNPQFCVSGKRPME